MTKTQSHPKGDFSLGKRTARQMNLAKKQTGTKKGGKDINSVVDDFFPKDFTLFKTRSGSGNCL